MHAQHHAHAPPRAPVTGKAGGPGGEQSGHGGRGTPSSEPPCTGPGRAGAHTGSRTQSEDPTRAWESDNHPGKVNSENGGARAGTLPDDVASAYPGKHEHVKSGQWSTPGQVQGYDAYGGMVVHGRETAAMLQHRAVHGHAAAQGATWREQGPATYHPNTIRCQTEAAMFVLRDFGTKNLCAELTGVRWGDTPLALSAGGGGHGSVVTCTQAMGAFRDGTALHRMLNSCCALMFRMKPRSSKTQKLYLRWSGSSRHVSAKGDPGRPAVNVSEYVEGRPGNFEASYQFIAATHPGFEHDIRTFLEGRLAKWQAQVLEPRTEASLAPPIAPSLAPHKQLKGEAHAPAHAPPPLHLQLKHEPHESPPPASPPTGPPSRLPTRTTGKHALKHATAAQQQGLPPATKRLKSKHPAKFARSTKKRSAPPPARSSSRGAGGLFPMAGLDMYACDMPWTEGGHLSLPAAAMDDPSCTPFGDLIQGFDFGQAEGQGEHMHGYAHSDEDEDESKYYTDTSLCTDGSDEDTVVDGNLRVHGGAMKPGSPLWTVFSDARLKQGVKRFTLGLGTVIDILPVCFRYNGLAGIPDDGKMYVGVIAQQLPPSLARYCRSRVRTRLHPHDTAETELFVVDHSCLQFVLVNAVRQLAERQRALYEAAAAREEVHEEACHGLHAAVDSCNQQVHMLRRQMDTLVSASAPACTTTTTNNSNNNNSNSLDKAQPAPLGAFRGRTLPAVVADIRRALGMQDEDEGAFSSSLRPCVVRACEVLGVPLALAKGDTNLLGAASRCARALGIATGGW